MDRALSKWIVLPPGNWVVMKGMCRTSRDLNEKELGQQYESQARLTSAIFLFGRVVQISSLTRGI